jgi:hypothetical protein
MEFTTFADLGVECAILTGGGCLAGLLLYAVAGGLVGVFAARPMLRWGLGDQRGAGCVAIFPLGLAGALVGLWAGGWGGGTLCAKRAIDERYVIEDFALAGLIEVATEGRPTGDPSRDASSLRSLVDRAGGSLRTLAEEAAREGCLEQPEARLPSFLDPEKIAQLVGELKEHELFDPEALATIAARGGFAAVVAGADRGLRVYAERVLETSEPIRREVLFGAYMALITNAIVVPLLVFGGLFCLFAVLAGASRLVRRSSGGPPQQPTGHVGMG